MSDEDNTDTSVEQQPTQSSEPPQVPIPPVSSGAGGIVSTNSAQIITSQRIVFTDDATIKTESSNEKD